GPMRATHVPGCRRRAVSIDFPTVASMPDMAHLDTVTTQGLDRSSKPPQNPAEPPTFPSAQPSRGWSSEPFDTRDVRKALERADRAVRRADRAARRLNRKKERAAGQ